MYRPKLITFRGITAWAPVYNFCGNECPEMRNSDTVNFFTSKESCEKRCEYLNFMTC